MLSENRAGLNDGGQIVSKKDDRVETSVSVALLISIGNINNTPSYYLHV